MFAFHQWGFSSGSGDRIPVPAETDRHVSLGIPSLPDTSSSSSSSLPHGLQLLHRNERGRYLCSCSSGRQVALRRSRITTCVSLNCTAVEQSPILRIAFCLKRTCLVLLTTETLQCCSLSIVCQELPISRTKTDKLTRTCFGFGPLWWAHQPPHGLVSAITVLFVEAVPATWTRAQEKTQSTHCLQRFSKSN